MSSPWHGSMAREAYLRPILKLLFLARLSNKILKGLSLKIQFIIYMSVYKENHILLSGFPSWDSGWAPRDGFNQWQLGG